jgi:hypothetical protein
VSDELTHQSTRETHRLVVEIDAYGMHTRLVCPESGCERPGNCSECGRSVDDAETKPCPECPSPDDECWLKSWADNVDLAMEGMVTARVEFPIEATWDGDGPVVKQLVEQEAHDG